MECSTPSFPLLSSLIICVEHFISRFHFYHYLLGFLFFPLFLTFPKGKISRSASCELYGLRSARFPPARVEKSGSASCELRIAECEISPRVEKSRSASCELRIAECEISPRGRKSRSASCELRIAECEISTRGRKSGSASCELRIAECEISPRVEKSRSASCELRIAECEISPRGRKIQECELGATDCGVRDFTHRSHSKSQSFTPRAASTSLGLHNSQPYIRNFPLAIALT